MSIKKLNRLTSLQPTVYYSHLRIWNHSWFFLLSFAVNLLRLILHGSTFSRRLQIGILINKLWYAGTRFLMRRGTAELLCNFEML